MMETQEEQFERFLKQWQEDQLADWQADYGREE